MFHFSGFRQGVRCFATTLDCYDICAMPGKKRPDVENGGKIIMPLSALEQLAHFNVDFPILFKLTNQAESRCSHAGVLEFVAEEDKCFMPRWMMNNLEIEEGDSVNFETASLPVATFAKFQPQHIEFLEITNPKAVLENSLRAFACLTSGDIIAINYNKKIYELRVLETQPEEAVQIIECDMHVEFEAPVGYVEPTVDQLNQKPTEQSKDREMMEVVDPFPGSGMRLDGKKKKQSQMGAAVEKKVDARGIPDNDFQYGRLNFDRTVKPISDPESKMDIDDNDANDANADEADKFQGQGLSMQKSKDKII